MAHAMVLAFSLCLLAQPQRPAGEVQAWQLAHDIMLLVQINQLRLSRKQVRAVLNVLEETGATAEAGRAAAEELKRLKQRLLRGEKVSWRELRDAMSLLRAPQRGRQRLQAAGQAAERVMEVLEDWQIALLVAGRGGLARPRLARRGGNRQADVLVELVDVDDAAWPQKRDELARRIAGPSGGSKQVYEAARDFLERVHKMDEQAIRAKSEELLAELQTLLPDDVPAVALLEPIDRAAARRRLMGLLSDPRLPEVLSELMEARGWTSPAR